MRVRKRKLLVYFLLLVSVVLVPFSVPSFDGSQVAPSQPSALTLPKLPAPLTWEQFLDFPRTVLDWVISSGWHMTQWYVGSFTSWHGFNLPIHPFIEPVSAQPSVDTSCTQVGSNAASINCSLNHAANVLILIFPMINDATTNSATVSSVTVAGFTATQITSSGSTTTLQTYIYWIVIPDAANDSVVVNYAGVTTNPEAMVAISFTNHSLQPFFANSRAIQTVASASTSSVTPPAGESARRLVNAVFTVSTNSITQGGSQTEITEVNQTGSSVEVNYQDTGSSVALTSSWTGAVNRVAWGLALLPPNQIITSAGSALNATGTGSITTSTSGTIATILHVQGAVCMVGVSVLNTTSQTVSSVVGASIGTFIKYTTVTNSTNIRTELWYLYDNGNTNTGTITVTLSASASAVMVGACFDNAKYLQLFEGSATNTGNSGTATSGNVVGSNTAGRRILLVAGFATAATPVGSQGVDLAGINANSIGVDLNFLDSSSTTNMTATDTSSQWAAIGVALLPFPITVDTSCSTTGASATSINCSLNHAANVLVVVWGGNAGSDTVSSVTVGGNAATLIVSVANGTAATIALYEYYATSAANDSVVVNYTSHNNNEALVATSFLGARSTAPFFNSEKTTSATTTTTCGNGGAQKKGEINGLGLSGTEISSAPRVSLAPSTANPSFNITQVSGNSNFLDFSANEAPAINKTIAPLTNANATCITIANDLLPSNQVVVDGITGGGTTGSQNVSGSTSGSTTSFTISLPSHNANDLVVVTAGIANGSSQTISTVKIGSTAFTNLTVATNGTSARTEVWFLYDTASGAETITITPSASVAGSFTAVAFANFSGCGASNNCFEGTATNTGSSASASAAVAAGTSNRRMLLAASFAENVTVVGSQGADLITQNQTSTSTGFNAFEQASGTAYTPIATDTSAAWACISTTLLDSVANTGAIAQTITNGNTVAETANHYRTNSQAATAGNSASEQASHYRTVTASNTSGYGNGSAFSNDASVGTVAWSNPSNAQTVNSVYATARQTSTIDTIGDTSHTTTLPTGIVFAFPVTASSSGTLSTIGVNWSTNGFKHITVGLYSDGGTKPNALLANSADIADGGIPLGWTDYSVSSYSIVAGTKYWVAVEVTVVWVIYYSVSTSSYSYYFKSYGALDSTWSVGSTEDSDETMNLRLTYIASTSQYLKALNFSSLNIPSTAQVLGVQVQVTRHASAASGTNDNSLKLVKAGTISGNDKASGTAWGTVDSTVIYGNTNDTWGLSNLTGADINASNFGVVLSVTTNGTASVDWIGVSVTYSEPSFGFSVTGIASLGRVLSQPVTFVNVVSKVASHLRTNPLAVTFVNVLSDFASHLRTNTLPITLANVLSSVASHKGNLTLTVNFVNIVSEVASHFRTNPLTLTFSNLLSEHATHPRTSSLPVSFVNSISVIVTFGRNLIQTFTFTFTSSTKGSFNRANILSPTFANTVTETASHLRSAPFAAVFVNVLTATAQHSAGIPQVVSFTASITRIAHRFANLSLSVMFAQTVQAGGIHYVIITQPFVTGITLMFFCAAGNTGSCGIAPQVIIQGTSGTTGGVQPSLLGGAAGQPLVPLSTLVAFILVGLILSSFFIGRFSKEQPKRKRDSDGYEVVAT